MNTSERKEIIQISGLSILVVMALLGDLLIAGVIFRWHQHEVYRSEKRHVAHMNQLLGQERQIKNAIVEAEGVDNWNQTSYMRTLPVMK